MMIGTTVKLKIDNILDKTNQKDNVKFKEWLETKEHLGQLFDSHLYKFAFDIIQNYINKENDYCTIIVGDTGTGKSTLAAQLCSLISPEFSMDDLCFTAEKVLNNAKKKSIGSCLWIDEGGLVLFSQESGTKEGRNMTKLFQTIRFKRYNWVVCIPRFQTINKSIREDRVDSVIYLSRRKKGSYTRIMKKGLPKFIERIKKGDHIEHAINKLPRTKKYRRRGHWNKTMPSINDFNPENYLRLKEDHVNKFIDQTLGNYKQEEKPIEDIEEKYMSTTNIGKLYGLHPDTIRGYIRNKKIKALKFGETWRISSKSLEKLGKQAIPDGGFSSKEETGEEIHE